MNNETLGMAAFMAAGHLVHGSEEISAADLHDMIFADGRHRHFTAEAVAYLKIAPSATAEDLVKFGAAKQLHLLPADSYATLGAGAKLFFDGFTYAAKGLIAGFAPKKTAPTIAPYAMPGDAEGDLHERAEAAPRRAPPAGVITVTPAAAAPREPAWTPSREEFMAMSPEERRGFAGAYGFPALLDEIAAGKPLVFGPAPEVEPERVIGPDRFEKEPGERAAAADPSSGPSGPLLPQGEKGGGAASKAKKK